MRIAIIMDMIAPYTTPVFEQLSRRSDCDLLVVFETEMEPSRRWQAETNLPYPNVVLRSWTLDLAWLAVGSRFKRRGDTYLYIPRRPLAPLARFRPDAVVAAGGGIWSSPTNLSALAARRWRGWAFVPWWGTFRSSEHTLPRRLAEPWVRKFVRSSDAWMAYGKRSAADLVRLGADPERVVVTPLVAHLSTSLTEAPKRVRDADRPLRYLFIGSLIERKGIDVLLEAFDSVTGGELWIVGDGPLANLVTKAATEDERIRVFGHRDEPDLEEIYRQVDVLVLPSRKEVWGLVVNEALGHGLAVIAADEVGAAADLIEPGVNGLVVAPDAPRSLAQAMNEIRRWTSNQWARSVECSEDKLAQRSVDHAATAIFEAASLGIEHRGRRRSAGADSGG